MSVARFWPRVAGTLASNVFLIVAGALTAVITARALGPDGRGTFAVLMTVTMVGVQFGNLGLPTANTWTVARDPGQLPALIGGSIIVAFGVGGVIAGGVYLFSDVLPGITPGVRPLLPWALAGIPFAILFMLAQNLQLGLQEVRRYNGLHIIQSGVSLLAMLAIVVAGAATAGGFYAAYFAATVACTAVALWLLIRRPGGIALPSLRLLSTSAAYGLRIYVATLFAFLVLHIDLLIVAAMLGDGAAGLYSIAARMGEMIYLLPVAVGTMLFATVSALQQDRWEFTRQVAVTIAIVLLPAVGLAAVLARPVVLFLFGAEFEGAVTPFLWLLPGVYAMGVNTILMQYLAARGMPLFAIAAPGAAAVLNIVLNLYLLPRMGIAGAALATTVTYCMMLLGSLVYLARTESGRAGSDSRAAAQVDLPPDNIYAHNKRLAFIRQWLRPGDRIVEFGCGTGYMLSYALAAEGRDVYGVDIDEESVRFGQRLFREAGFDAERLQAIDFRDFAGPVDAVIASEVLEHISTPDLPVILTAIRDRLEPDGRLFVTVPNGYGWFELEQFMWQRLGVGWLFEKLGLSFVILGAKTRVLGRGFEPAHPATLAASPHLQRFTPTSIRSLLEQNGFVIEATTGSAVFAGPFSHLFFSGVTPLMAANAWLGGRWPALASGFYLVCTRAPGAVPATLQPDAVSR